MKFRRFTSAGISAVRDFLAQTKASSTIDLAARDKLLSESGPSDLIPELADLDFDPTRTFATTFEFCEYLHSLIKDRKPLSYRSDVGFWTFLSMAFLEQLVHIKNGNVILGADQRLIYEVQTHVNAHRHLLVFPFYLYVAYRDQLELTHVVLCHRLNSINDLVEQVISRQYVLQNRAFMSAITQLYFNAQRETPKRGSGGDGPGAIRRFLTMIDQLSMTRDFFEVPDADQLIDLLPDEFSKFKENR